MEPSSPVAIRECNLRPVSVSYLRERRPFAVSEWKEKGRLFHADDCCILGTGKSGGGAFRGLFHRAISESSALNLFQAYRLSEPSGGPPSLARPQGGKPPYEEFGLQLARARGIEDGPDAAGMLREIPVAWLMDFMISSSPPRSGW